MNSKILIGLTAVALGVVAVGAQAHDRRWHDDDDDYDRAGSYARVLDVDPIVEHVRYAVPVEHCWNEERTYGHAPNGAAIVGGALGAIVGHNIGSGDDRPVATLAGAVIGAAIGNEVGRDAREDRYARRGVVQRCETRMQERWDERVVGYRVAYVFRGWRDVVQLDYDPGRWLRMDDARHYR